MLKKKEQAFKRKLLDQAGPFIPDGEQVRVVAQAHARIPHVPFLLAMAIGGALVANGLFDNDLPRWLGFAGVGIGVVGIAGFMLIPKRFLVRTNEALYVFSLHWYGKNLSGDAPKVIPSQDLPADSDEKSIEVGGERLWGIMGNKRERAAIGETLAPELS